MNRQTVRREARWEGLGLHSGVPVRVTAYPGQNGIAFRYSRDRVLALPENVTDTRRCTKLGAVSTVEHLMSALAGLEITDVEIEASAPELPALDGSAAAYVAALSEAGLEKIGELELPDLFTRVFVQEDGIKIAVSKGVGRWSYRYESGERWPGDMTFECENVVERYIQEIAPARTFAHSDEIPHILEAGMAKGLNEDSAVVLGPSGYENPARFPDEPARHKLLDLMGDLYLSGVPAGRLNVSAERSGHAANVRAAAILRDSLLKAR